MNAPMPSRTEEEPVDLGDLPRSVGFMIRMAQAINYESFFRTFEDKTLKPGEFSVIWVIALNPEIKQGTLAQTLNIKPAHMTKLVQRFVNAGLVDRTVPPEDRRSIRLTLTDAGRTYFSKHRAGFLKVHDTEGIGLTRDETEQLLELLQKLVFKGRR